MDSNKLTETIRADDYVEYFLFPSLDQLNGKDTNEKLNNFLGEVNAFVKNLTNNYIWHKEPFQLIARTTETTKQFIENAIEGI